MFKAASIPVLLGIAFSQTLPAQTTPTEPYSPTQPVDKTMSQHSLTIYSRAQPGAINPAAFRSDSPSYQPTVPGYAMVRTTREMDLSQSSVEFTDVAASIDPTTVTFKSLSHPNATRVLEQNYRYDLVSTERMLEQFIGQELTLRTAMGAEVETFQGTLMASRGNAIVLELDDGRLVSLADVATISFPNLPGGLITKPTLQWEVATSEPRSQQVEVSYETAGMTWWADYNLLLDETDGCAMDLQAWVSIVNHSGGSFPQARLKLIAGDVNRAPQAQTPRMQTVRRNVSEMAMADDGFKEQSFFEYHLYTLGRPASLPDRSLKQLELFPAALGVECRKQLTFAAGYQPWNVFSEPFTRTAHPQPLKGEVAVSLQFRNARDNNLGLALPAGRVRVSQRNGDDGNLEFIGEDVIDHTPRNELLDIALGNAFDVVGERRQADFRWQSGARWMEETIEVELRNQKDVPATIRVRESLLRWTNWQLTRHSHDFDKTDAATVEFDVTVAPEASETISYTARYEW